MTKTTEKGETQKVVRAQTFEVVDEEGKIRATLGMLKDGTVGLSLYNDKGEQQLFLSVGAEGGSGVRVGSAQDKQGAWALVGVGKDDRAFLALQDASKATVFLQANDGKSEVGLFETETPQNKSKEGAVAIAVGDAGSHIFLSDKDGNRRLVAAVVSYKGKVEPTLGFVNAKGKITWNAVSGSGGGLLKMAMDLVKIFLPTIVRT